MSDNSTVSATILLRLDGDDQANRAVNKLTSTEKALKIEVQSVNKAMDQRSDSAKQAADSEYTATQRAITAERHRQDEIEATNEALKAQEKFADSAIAASIDASAKAQAAQVEAARANSGGGSSSNGVDKIDRGLGTVERLAGSLGASGINQVTGIAGDAIGVGQALLGVGAGLGSVLAVAAPVAAAIGGVTFVLSKVQEQAEQSTVALKANYEEQIRQASQATQNREAARSKTAEQNKQDAADLAQDIDNYGKILSDLRDKRSQVDKEYSGLGASFNPVRRSNLGAQGQELDKQITETRKHLDELNAQYQNATLVLPDLIDNEKDRTDALKAAAEAQAEQVSAAATQAQREVRDASLIRNAREGSASALKEQIAGIGDQVKAASNELLALQEINDPSEETTQRIKDLKKQISDLAQDSYHLSTAILPVVAARDAEAAAAKKQEAAFRDATKAADEYAANSVKLQDLEASQSALLEKRARDDSRASQVSALESQISAAKQIEAEQERAAKVVGLRKKAGDEEAQAVAKYRDDVKKLNADFMANELKQLRAFQLEEARADSAHKLDRIRKLEDLYTSLSDLAASGDVASFITTQRAGIRDIKRGDEDAGIASRQRTEDYTLGVQERTDERRQRLEELQQQAAAERTQRQANLQVQLQQEEAAGKQRVLKSAQLQEQLTALRDQWAKEDLLRTRQQEDAQIASQIAAVKKRNDELRPLITKFLDPAATSVKNFATTVGNNLADMYNRVRAAAAGASTPRPRTGGSGVVAMNALGDVYTKPTLAGLAEIPGFGDAVVPFRQSEGVLPALQRILDKAGGSRGGLTISHLEIKAGSIATPDDLAALRADVLGGIQDAAKALGASGSLVLGGGMA